MIIYLYFGLIALALLTVFAAVVVVLVGGLLGALIGGSAGRKIEGAESYGPRFFKSAHGCFLGMLISLFLVIVLLALAWQYVIS